MNAKLTCETLGADGTVVSREIFVCDAVVEDGIVRGVETDWDEDGYAIAWESRHEPGTTVTLTLADDAQVEVTRPE